jgi:drug/metabolite transporter (DMT)-like permease
MQNIPENRQWSGTFLVTGSAVAYSTAGFFTRLIDLDVYTLLFWRGLFAGLFMGICIVATHRRETFPTLQKIGFPGLLVALLSTIATICYLNALRLTTVAEVMAINATSPFISGALAWVMIGERENWKVTAASLVALLGVVIMVGPSAMSGKTAGALLALAMTFSLALMIVVMRAKKSISMLPASCLSAFLSALVVSPFVSTTIPTGLNMLNLALFGTAQFGLGLILLTLGTRHITALRTSLLSRLQTVLGPMWVWLASDEIPPTPTLIGGSLVVLSTFAAALVAIKPGR